MLCFRGSRSTTHPLQLSSLCLLSLGSIVGVLLDLWHGTLTFYLNKRPLNVAFSGLTPGKAGYYAMVSSTAARTGVRLIRAESHSVSLQYLSLLKIRRSHHDPASILNLVTMPPGLQVSPSDRLQLLHSCAALFRSEPCGTQNRCVVSLAQAARPCG